MQNNKSILAELSRFDEITQRNILVQFVQGLGLGNDFIAFVDKEYGQDDEGWYDESKCYD